jgi:hypothetical protein
MSKSGCQIRTLANSPAVHPSDWDQDSTCDSEKNVRTGIRVGSSPQTITLCSEELSKALTGAYLYGHIDNMLLTFQHLFLLNQTSWCLQIQCPP